VFTNVKKLGMSSKELADYLLSEAGVAVLAGTDFGEYGEGYPILILRKTLRRP